MRFPTTTGYKDGDRPIWECLYFSTSHEACARVRERIAELGKQQEFVDCLVGAVYDDMNNEQLAAHLPSGRFTFRLIDAPPRAQIIASILAVEEK